MSKGQKAVGSRQKAESGRQRAESRKQKAESKRRKAVQIRQIAASCLLLAAFWLYVAGCARAPKVPGQSMLPKRFKAAAWEQIVAIEHRHRPDCRPRIVKSEVVETGRGTVVERWVVRACGTTVDYLVSLISTERGQEVRVAPPPEFSATPGAGS